MSDRVAILVIHGMGTQKPYETLDQFARGVSKMLPKPAPDGKGVAYNSEICYRQHDDDPAHQQKAWTQAFVRLTPVPSAPNAPPAAASPDVIDLVEYYWAPIINGRVKAVESLQFLIRSALSPFDFLRANMLVIDQVSGKTDGAEAKVRHEGFSNSKTKQLLFILFREIYRSLLIFFPLLLLCAGLYAFLAQPVLNVMVPGGPPTWLHFFWTGPEPGWGDAIVLALVVLRWLLIGMALKYFWDGRTADSGRTPDQRSALRQCSIAIGLLLLFLISLPFVLELVMRSWPVQGTDSGFCFQLPRWVGSIWRTIRGLARMIAFVPLSLRLAHLAAYGLLALLAYLINRFLTTAVGDLTVYLGSDALSENFAARSQIMSECTSTVKGLLAPKIADLPRDSAGCQHYDRILVAAHSLGTVIAYDVLNDLIVKDSAAGVPEATSSLRRICGLFTFGCPLNKVYYFFRSRTAQRTSILSAILYDLHSFRLRVPAPAGGVGAGKRFGNSFRWLNAWSPYDVISGRMLFYEADKNLEVTAGHEPVSAHTGYWEDDDLYRFFSGLL